MGHRFLIAFRGAWMPSLPWPCETTHDHVRPSLKRGMGEIGMCRLLALSVVVARLVHSDASAAEPTLLYVPYSTQRICQLTGNFDRATKVPTLSQTGKRFGLPGTDLGSSFEHKGGLVFLFGDTYGRPGDRDVLAWTASKDPTGIVLQFHRAPDHKWLPLTVPGIKQGAFEVPSGGISVGGDIFVVCTTDHSEDKMMGRSVLALSHNDGRTFRPLYELSRAKFINVSFWLDDDWLYIFGSGDYRKSNVCLARVRPADLRDRRRLEYFSGIEGDAPPHWSPREDDAVALFEHPQVGEFSVSHLKPVNRYVMLYNALKPRGIIMRSSETPWGSWSEGTVIFEPTRDNGYGHFMHTKNRRDGLSDPNRVAEWGGEYGPYIMSRYTAAEEGHCAIYYTMSTWNPYQVMVMRSKLKLADAPQHRASKDGSQDGH